MLLVGASGREWTLADLIYPILLGVKLLKYTVYSIPTTFGSESAIRSAFVPSAESITTHPLVGLGKMQQPLPTGQESRLPIPLGGPHQLFDGSFIIEFLQPAPELQATVLMRATYVGDHHTMKLGKQHPQAS
jgi:hypothetical protein